MTGLGAPMLVGVGAVQPVSQWGLELRLSMGGGYLRGSGLWRWMERRLANGAARARI